jgi:hypothetical protein
VHLESGTGQQLPPGRQEQAEAIKAEAKKLPYGKERQVLEAKARHLEIAANINHWLSSPGLQPPKLAYVEATATSRLPGR